MSFCTFCVANKERLVGQTCNWQGEILFLCNDSLTFPLAKCDFVVTLLSELFPTGY